MNDKAVIIFSGGLDSTTLLYDLVNQDVDVHPISFIYKQKHMKEVFGAKKICEKLGLTQKLVDISFLGEFGGSSLTDNSTPVPEGHYADELMKLTVVPNRNMVMIAIATSYAISINASSIFYGAHAGDHAIYPDCRPAFVKEMNLAISLCDYNSLTLNAPYLYLSKGDVVKRGLKLGVPYEDTWTCYNGREKPCGKCGSCVERLEAFAFNNISDPLQYEEQT